MAENQNIIDLFDQYLKRAPTAEELAMLADTSNYAAENYLRAQNTFNDSSPYKTRYAEIQQMGEDMFGYGFDINQVDQWIRQGISDSELVFQWRHSPTYQQMFVGKPAWMSEKEYRGINEKFGTEKQSTLADFQAYGGRTLSDDELRKIYFGGPGSEEIRKQWVTIQGRKASQEAIRGKLSNTSVTQTAFGPTQQLMQGISSATGSTELPQTERFASYKDYKAGTVNPKFDTTNMEAVK